MAARTDGSAPGQVLLYGGLLRLPRNCTACRGEEAGSGGGGWHGGSWTLGDYEDGEPFVLLNDLWILDLVNLQPAALAMPVELDLNWKQWFVQRARPFYR